MKEVWEFLRNRKRYWLTPILITAALIALLIIFASNAGVESPFEYDQ